MPFFRRPHRSEFSAEEIISNEDSDLTRRSFLGMGCACCVSMAVFPSQVMAQTAEVTRHLEAARTAAGSDLSDYLRNGECRMVARKVIPNFKPVAPMYELMSLPAPPPGRAFDNLYFVGSKWVSAWVIATSEGLILIDTMDNDDEAERIVDGGLRKLGLDPSQIKIIVITHGHGDHYGGANYFKRRYNPEIAMSEIDWRMIETGLESDYPGWGQPPRRDRSVDDGSKIQLGDTTLDVLLTPGHTMGTISLLFDVRNGVKSHRVLLWGGTALNLTAERVQAYIDATERAREVVQQQGVDVFITNHDFYDRAVDKLAAMQPGAANPFVLGTPGVQRALTVMNECGRATLATWK